jgi:hypothetical protein
MDADAPRSQAEGQPRYGTPRPRRSVAATVNAETSSGRRTACNECKQQKVDLEDMKLHYIRLSTVSFSCGATLPVVKGRLFRFVADALVLDSSVRLSLDLDERENEGIQQFKNKRILHECQG